LKNLQINVLRGENRIGENLIEITDGVTKILLECGIALCETDETRTKEEAVVKTEYDGVIVSHCHADHSGLLKRSLCAKKIFMGKATYQTLAYYGGVHDDNLSKIRHYKSEEAFYIGEIKITPYLCDHSAYDSYMIELEKDGDRVLYTGDFRANGRKNFSAFLERLPNSVDCLITERTNLRLINETERDVEEKAVKLMQEHDRVFILQSALNVDRTVSFYRAAARMGKVFIMSLPCANVGGMYENIPNPLTFSSCYTYLKSGQTNKKYQEIKHTYERKLIGRKEIAQKRKFVMQIHSGMLGYLQKMAQERSLDGSLLIYSMWQGYKEGMTSFLEGVKTLGIKTVDLHVSGHADRQTVGRLIRKTCPKELIMVHCEK
jgi:ribonuclease J